MCIRDSAWRANLKRYIQSELKRDYGGEVPPRCEVKAGNKTDEETVTVKVQGLPSYCFSFDMSMPPTKPELPPKKDA